MKVVNGKGVSDGIAFGKLYFYEREQLHIRRVHVEDTGEEIKRFESVKEKAIAQLQELYEKALSEVGEAEAMIFQIHQMMLEDLDYCESIIDIIKQEQVNAEYAAGVTGEKFAQMFSTMDDSYMKERAVDVRDVSRKLIKIMSNMDNGLIVSDEPVIIVTDDFLPSEIVQIDKSKLLGFVLMHGSSNSHTAILARTMNIPSVIGVTLGSDYDGKMGIINGFDGVVYIEPDENTTAELADKKNKYADHIAFLQTLKGQPNITKDGQKVVICANAGHVPDVDLANKNDADGIGLFRSEFLYLERKDYPSEEDQFEVYKAAAKEMDGKQVIIRTMDIGADKQADYFDIPKEENPALGYRAIRICLDRKDIFKTQLRAIYRASAFGKLAIMFPMIISVDEVLEIKSIIEEVKKELREQNIPYSDDIEIGIMIETPAAAIISDILAKEVDFFSIGTNDLTQYTLAIDRQNQKLDSFYNPNHKAILRLIKMVADNAHKYGKWVGICGELAGKIDLTETFLAIGIDELSVSSSKVLELRHKVRETDVGKAKDLLLKSIGDDSYGISAR